MPKILTDEAMDKWLIANNSPVKRLEHIDGANKKILWQCLNIGCTNKWLSAASTLKKGTGCPKCAGVERITDQNMDQWLIDNYKPIKRIGKINGTHKQINFECLDVNCKNVWLASPHTIKGNGSCPKCWANPKKISDTDIDNWLIENKISIKRIGSVAKINTCDPICWECIICKYNWNTSFISIKHNETRCPKCSGHAPLTDQIIDERLSIKKRTISRVGKVNGANNPIKWKCTIANCLYEWTAAPSAIVGSNETGCPKCANRIPLTNQIMDEWLAINIPSIKRIGDVFNSFDNIYWKCLDCNYEWKTAPNHIKKRTKCPDCAGHAATTNIRVENYFIKNNLPIKRIEDINKVHGIKKWECLDCGIIWKSSYREIKYNGRNCPNCNKKSANEWHILNYMINRKIIYDYQYKILNNVSSKGYFLIDFYLPQMNTFIEYNGHQHYEPVIFGKSMTYEDAKKRFVLQQIRDKFVEQYAALNNIKLIIIDGRQYKGDKLLKYLDKIFCKGQQ